MPSTATTRLRLEKMALGENSATWGAPKLNTVLDLVDEAVGGVEAVTISGATTTLTSTNYASDQARNACLVLTGTLGAASSVVVPNAEKVYLVVNNTTMGAYTLTIKTAAGAGVSLKTGPQWVYCDATAVFTASPRLDQLAAAGAAIDMGGFKVTNSAIPTATTDLATKAYVDGVAVGVDATAAVAALTASLTASLALKAPLASPTFTSSVLVSTGTVAVPLGTVSAPTYSFSGDSNTGLYSSGADSVSLVAGGTARATASTSGLGVTGTLSTTGAASLGSTLGVTGAATLGSTLSVTGSVTAASVASSGAVSGTTLAASGAATLSSTLAVTGAITATGGLTAAAPVLTAAGTVSAPSHSFSTDTNTGLYSGGADVLKFTTGGTERMSIDAAGTVSVVGSGGGQLVLTETATSTIQAQKFVMAAVQKGNIDISTTGVTYNTASDYRLKENITPLTEAVDRLEQLRPKRFQFISDPSHQTMEGFIAHEVAEVVPAAVSGEKDGTYSNGQPMYQSIDASRLVPLLVAAVQELALRVEALEDEV
jgi:hypothetical protein